MNPTSVGAGQGTSLPFGARITFTDGAAVNFLPSPRVTVFAVSGAPLFLGPHDGLFQRERVDWIVSARPEMAKLLFGKVERFVDRTLGLDRLPLLELFADISDADELVSLLRDGRESVELIWDEQIFVQWWTDGRTLDPGDRRLQRICRRYGGQSPKRIRIQAELGAALLDYVGGGTDFLDIYADQSHFIRTCRRLTGRTPGEIRKMSGLFYR